VKDGAVATCRLGAGIVADSDPGREHAETLSEGGKRSPRALEKNCWTATNFSCCTFYSLCAIVIKPVRITERSGCYVFWWNWCCRGIRGFHSSRALRFQGGGSISSPPVTRPAKTTSRRYHRSALFPVNQPGKMELPRVATRPRRPPEAPGGLFPTTARTNRVSSFRKRRRQPLRVTNPGTQKSFTSCHKEWDADRPVHGGTCCPGISEEDYGPGCSCSGGGCLPPGPGQRMNSLPLRALPGE